MPFKPQVRAATVAALALVLPSAALAPQGTPRPRLVVTRSARHVFVQVVDDVQGRTLASASTMEPDLRALAADKTAKAHKVGELVGRRAKDAGVEAVVFDRGGKSYHGRVAAIADGAREAGLSL